MKMAEQLKALSNVAVLQYTNIVNDILDEKITDEQELIQSQYGLINDNSPEYQCTYNLIRRALLRDEKILTLFQQHGLSEDFIDSCRGIKED